MQEETIKVLERELRNAASEMDRKRREFKEAYKMYRGFRKVARALMIDLNEIKRK